MQKIILYYIFTPLGDPEAIRLWQRNVAERYNLKGRILVSKHGLNGTVGGHIDDVKKYVKETKQYAPFKQIQFKWNDGTGNDFPRLSVKVRDEIVSFCAKDELKVDKKGVVGGGKHLKPEQVHELVKERGDDVVFFDGRNKHESDIGKFKNAVTPNVETTRDFIAEIEKPEYEYLKDKPVVTYCTGGIRCEILSSLMKNRGFQEVYQIDGGIDAYGKTYGDDGLWEGSLYVFDGRMSQRFSENSKDIGQCVHCAGKTSNYENCAIKNCNKLVLVCENCRNETDTCSDVCAENLPAKLAHSE